MEVIRKELLYINAKMNEDSIYYQLDDDCEDFKVFVNDKNEVFLIRNTKNLKCQFFPNQ